MMENINNSKAPCGAAKLPVGSGVDMSPASMNASGQESMIGKFSDEAGSQQPQLRMNQRDVGKTVHDSNQSGCNNSESSLKNTLASPKGSGACSTFTAKPEHLFKDLDTIFTEKNWRTLEELINQVVHSNMTSDELNQISETIHTLIFLVSKDGVKPLSMPCEILRFAAAHAQTSLVNLLAMTDYLEASHLSLNLEYLNNRLHGSNQSECNRIWPSIEDDTEAPVEPTPDSILFSIGQNSNQLIDSLFENDDWNTLETLLNHVYHSGMQHEALEHLCGKLYMAILSKGSANVEIPMPCEMIRFASTHRQNALVKILAKIGYLDARWLILDSVNEAIGDY